ncbi:PLDc N-terminal domain-containing protein [Candidatus Woesearchaeota archaeon]|nr:PLDc N-terminal domain-containing protein [Candidatus Woesearchaeota archaeon]
MLFIAALLIGSFIFWLIMLIDCIKREFDQKALWIILILVLGIVGAILYYFMVKRKGP